MRNLLEKGFVYYLFNSALLVLTQGAPTKGKFHESPQDVAVKSGEDVILTCRIKQSSGDSPVAWSVFKANGYTATIAYMTDDGARKISPGFPRCFWANQPEPGRVSDHNYKVYDLLIKHTGMHDSGNYSCEATATNYKKIRLEVLWPAPKDISVLPGEMARFGCGIPYVRLVWWTITKGDGHHKLKPRQQSENGKPTAYSDRVTYDWSLAGGSSYDIIVNNAQKSDRGVYRCVTQPNRTGAEWRLRVLYDGDPVFGRRPHDTYAFYNKHVTLRCSVHARRGGKVIVRWKKAADSRNALPKYYPFKHNDSEPFGHGDFQWGNWKMSGNFDLTLFFNKKSDEGSYWCEAWPEHYDQFDEVVTAAATLRVIKKPKGSKGQYIPTLQRTMERKRVGGSARFSCIPKYKVIWLDVDMNILTDNSESKSEDKRFKISPKYPEDLLISNIQVRDAQKYYCVLAGDKFVWEKTVQLVVEGCSSGNWHYDEDLHVCFLTPKPTIRNTFGGALSWCRENNAHLAMPKNSKKAKALQKLSKTIWGYEMEMWIGLDTMEWFHHKVWKWADGRLLTGNEHYWSPGQPDNKGGHEHCGAMDESTEFRDDNCQEKHAFICEGPGIHWNRIEFMKRDRCKGRSGWIAFDCGELCYWKSKEKMTWAQARDSCESQNGRLAMLLTERLWRVGALMVGSGDPQTYVKMEEAWIGLRAVGSGFEWIDGYFELWTWIRWSTNHGSGDCFSMDANGRVNNRDCMARKYFICQQPQDRLRINGRIISICGKTERPVAPIRTKRGAGPEPVSRNNKTNDQLAIAPIFNVDTITIEDAPWAVRVIVNGKVVCSGALIGPKTVLTSGTCVLHKRTSNMSSHDVMIGLGSEDRSATGGRLEPVHMIKVHANYDLLLRDIAVIELKRRLIEDCWNVRRACLPPRKDADFSGFKCKVISWGAEGALRYCDVDYDSLLFRASIGTLFFVSKKYYCHMGDADTGAPLVCIDETAGDPQWTLVGIYSEDNGRYSEFTYVAYYLKWIRDKMQGNDLPENEFYYEVACDQQHVDISCDFGRPPLIQIVQAWYGIRSKHRCAYQHPRTPSQVGCQSDVTQKVRQRCVATNRCQFDVTTEQFGNPCSYRTDEYLYLIYKCVNVPGKQNDFYAVICDLKYEEMHLTCGQENELLIVVRKAEYGNGPAGVCTDRIANCDKQDKTKEIAERCDGKVMCTWLIDFRKWEDPCPGFKSHLGVGYTCVKRSEYHHRVGYSGHSSGENLQPSAIMMVLAISSCLLLRA